MSDTVAVPGTATIGRPIVAEDLFRLLIVSDIQMSPDGQSVAYLVTRLDQDADDYKAAIWTAPIHGGTPRQLTAGTARDGSPRWSPDGRQIAFVSNRPGETPEPPSTNRKKQTEEQERQGRSKSASNAKEDGPKPQIWVIAVGGGEARQLTRQPFGATSPTWSPDGHAIAFLSPTPPEHEPKSHDGEGTGTVADERLITEIRYRYDGRGFIERHDHVWTIPSDGGDARQLTTGDTDDAQPTWSPDGARIAFVSNRTPDHETNGISAIYAVPAQGGSPRCLTDGAFAFSAPTWSPDGSRLAVIGTDDPLAGGAKNANLWTVPAGGGTPINHTRDWDRSFGDHGMSDVYMAADDRPVWSPDGGRVYALASDRGSTHIHRVTLQDGSVERLTSGSRRIVSFAVAPGVSFCYISGEAHRPFEVFTADAAGRDERQLTEHNREFLNEVALSPSEEILFRSKSDGAEIQGWILKPPGFQEGSPTKYPMILQIHGGPHAMYGHAMFHEMQLMAARGYVVLYTNPRGSSGYGEDFTSSTRGRWGEHDMPDVMGALDAILERGYVDSARVGVTGGSYGGYLTNWIIGHTDRFKAAVTQRCVANFYSFFGTSDIGFTFGQYEFGGTPWSDTEKLLHHSPISYVESMTTPLLIIHNEQDLRCPIEQAEQLFVFLKKLGRQVAFVRIPGEDHNLSRTGKPSRRLARLHHLIGWFDTHL